MNKAEYIDPNNNNTLIGDVIIAKPKSNNDDPHQCKHGQVYLTICYHQDDIYCLGIIASLEREGYIYNQHKYRAIRYRRNNKGSEVNIADIIKLKKTDIIKTIDHLNTYEFLKLTDNFIEFHRGSNQPEVTNIISNFNLLHEVAIQEYLKYYFPNREHIIRSTGQAIREKNSQLPNEDRVGFKLQRQEAKCKSKRYPQRNIAIFENN